MEREKVRRLDSGYETLLFYSQQLTTLCYNIYNHQSVVFGLL